MNRIIFQMPDGNVRVCIPAHGHRPDESEDQWLDRIANLSAPLGAIRLANTEATELPSRRFRGAWRIVNGKIEVSMPLARDQRLAEIRTDRNNRLAESDGPMLRAMERGSLDVTIWKIYRQALRDMPQVIDLTIAKTSEILSSLELPWPQKPE